MLVLLVAIFVAYNANRGLPFVSTYQISVDVPNAAALVPGNDVRIGGIRVGFVKSVSPVQDPETGDVHARLGLQLDKTAEPLPADSTVVVRSSSAVGSKYLELDPGQSSEGYPPGATVPLRAARPHPVELDQLFNTFDRATRHAIRQNLVAFGEALAGRGPALNAALGRLRPLLDRLQPVMRNLASPRTGLARFIRASAATAAEVAPVAETQAQLFVALDATFGSLASVARPFIQETISETPLTLTTLIRNGPRIRAFLGHTTALVKDLRPGVRSLTANAPAIAAAFETGARVLPDAPSLNAQLAPTARSLAAFAHDAGVNGGIDRSTQLFGFLTPTLGFVTPAQTVCDYGTLLLRNGSSLLSVGDGVGTTQRFLVMSAGDGPNSENSPSSGPAHGGTESNFLHSNPYPYTASPGQPHVCAAGNEQYVAGRVVVGNPPLLATRTGGLQP